MSVKIIPNLWLGHFGESETWLKDHPDGMILCLCEPTEIEYATHWFGTISDISPIFIPLLRGGFDTVKDQMVEWVDPRALDAAASLIDFYQQRCYDLLVCCAMGQERSPLAIAWFFYKWRGQTLDDAYTFLKYKKDDVCDRREWLVGEDNVNSN